MGLSRLRQLPLPKTARTAWVFAILACIAVFLFTDKSQDTACIHNVVVYDLIVLPHNCDALALADTLLQAQTFYTSFHNWKGRPVYHAYGMVAGNALIPIAYPLWAVLYPGATAKNQLPKFGASFNFHLAYFLLNIGVVIACAWIGIRVSGLENTSWLAVALAAAIASTDLVEAGVWLLHTNIFNLASAFGTLLFVVLGMQRTILDRTTVLGGGLLIGLGVLIYPAIAIVAPGYVIGRLIGRLKVANDRAPTADEAVELLLFAAAVVLPIIVWWGANRILFDTATYLTAEKGQFAWAPQAWSDGRLIEQLGQRLSWFYGLVVKASGVEYGMALASIAVLMAARWRGGLRSLVTDPIIWAVLLAMVGVLAFNFLQGYHAPRLHVAAAYVLYVAVARIAKTRRCEALGSLCLLAITGYQMANAITTYAVSGD